MHGLLCKGYTEVVDADLSQHSDTIPHPAAVHLGVKSVGKPCAGKPYARFDERGWETELWYGLRHQHIVKAAGKSYSLYPQVTAPIFDSTSYASQGDTPIILFYV